MKKGWLFTLLVVLSVVLAACGGTKTAENTGESTGTGSEANAAAEQSSEEIVIKHQLGETTVKKNPQKVVVFDYGVLDSLDQLGVEVAGVPQEGIPPYLEKYNDAKYTNVGGLKEADFEKVNAMSPDLIIISGRLSDSYEELSEIAPTIYMAVDTEDYMNSLTSNVKTLGEIFGKEAEAEQQLASIESSAKALKDKVTAAGKNALIVLTNEGKLSAYGAGSRFGVIHDVFGFTPADANIEVSTHGQSVSFEYVMETNPDYLFVVDRSAVVAGQGEAAPAKQVIENDLVKNTTAYKEGHIVYLDPNYWYLSGGGLESIQEMIKEVDASVN
ncbi:siderophore ABC transporter substrate-binding protein [Paenibacillus xylanilyticus]|uniref:Siderophore ABC transporter substrate-binding protein n=1 Tax=Paenibacillus xylanilyticus TaxID=248903 RepID=A0A7Y6BY62_9BACL|nr:siderophore ABC transporter substrate-binding protein [Paenibacillus xylanilyticus]NUU77085.1 siderophore ABC transporter substrate-binding protein [Paenibacillus xylanilyticus]